MNKKIISTILLICLSLLAIFHIFVMTKIIPSNIVWGGQISSGDFLIMEIISLIVTILFILIVLIKSDYIKASTKIKKIAHIGIWIMTFYFGLNIITNLFAQTITEKVIFIPLSIILVFCCINIIK
jgi:hypothetical protein